MDLADRTALVTGANRGIGLAIAKALAAEPVNRVLLGMRDPDGFDAFEHPKAEPVKLDLSSRESIDACAAALDLDQVDLLVNNAGAITGGLLEEQDLTAIYDLFQVNLVAVAHMTRLVLPGMLARGSGKVVNNASISGYAYFPAATTYSASKAGVVALTESLRRELRGTGVTALHLVTPGVNTRMLDRTEEAYGSHMDTSSWDKVEPEEWAQRVVEAIRDDRAVLGPGGRTALAKLASRGPGFLLDAFSSRAFSR